MLKNMKISQTYICIFILFVVLPVVIVGGVLYRAYINNLITNSSSGIMQKMSKFHPTLIKKSTLYCLPIP
jgi:hypothetical protein